MLHSNSGLSCVQITCYLHEINEDVMFCVQAYLVLHYCLYIEKKS